MGVVDYKLVIRLFGQDTLLNLVFPLPHVKDQPNLTVSNGLKIDFYVMLSICCCRDIPF